MLVVYFMFGYECSKVFLCYLDFITLLLVWKSKVSSSAWNKNILSFCFIQMMMVVCTYIQGTFYTLTRGI